LSPELAVGAVALLGGVGVFLTLEYRSALLAGTTTLGLLVGTLWLLHVVGVSDAASLAALWLAVGGGAAASAALPARLRPPSGGY
jgi:hypothetical protein